MIKAATMTSVTLEPKKGEQSHGVTFSLYWKPGEDPNCSGFRETGNVLGISMTDGEQVDC
jgi:hypothetical protein